MKIEVMKSANALIQNYTEPETRVGTMVIKSYRKCLPYSVVTKVEYPIGSSESLPPCLDAGGDGRKSGVKGRTEPKTPLKKDQKPEIDNDSSLAEKETPKTIKKRKTHKNRAG